MGEYTVNVVHCKKTKEPAEYVGRPSPLGNPFTVKEHGRGTAIDLYKDWLNLQYANGNTHVINEIERLAYLLKKNGEITLSCWCVPNPCHADLIAKALLKIVKR